MGDCYEYVYALWNYGQILSRSEQTRLEGQDYLQRAEQMFQAYPQWAERKLNYFVPAMTIDDNQIFSANPTRWDWKAKIDGWKKIK